MIVSIVALLALLTTGAGAMVREGESIMMSVAGMIAIASAPMLVTLLECIQLPRAERRAMATFAVEPETSRTREACLRRAA